jgi:fumarate reductase iron-sulfur subunit
MGLLACEDVCPKGLPLQDQLGFLRRKMGITAIKSIFKRS